MNFKSIRDEQTISLLALDSLKSNVENLIDLKKNQKFNLLKTSVVYGANAAGKSNIILALLYMQHFIINSTDIKLGQNIPYFDPFCLEFECLNAPTKFEVEFISSNSIRYSYSFTYSQTKILEEKLSFFPAGRENLLFHRIEDNITFGTKLKGNKSLVAAQLLENNLFLSKGANSNIEQLKNVYLYFRNLIYIDIKSENTTFAYKDTSQHTQRKLNNENDPLFKEMLENFLKSADTGIQGIKIEKQKINLDKLSKNEAMRDGYHIVTNTLHKRFEAGKLKDFVSFSLSKESRGTIKMFEIAGSIIDALHKGAVLVIDELDASLHPLMSDYIIKIFNSAKYNTKNAQLIFTTHDTSLLNSSNFRADQIWFAEKDDKAGTCFFSLAEFDKKDLKSVASMQNWYLSGRFGALPLIDKSLFKIKNT